MKHLEKPEASQMRSPLAGAEQRRTPRVKPQQKRAPSKHPKGHSKKEAGKSFPPSNGPRFVERVETVTTFLGPEV
ncbi:hypothetical protein TSAR_002520 [Trichomalopsis sarcophagae]|uniref:Uncharacterized protein n=1 Tax=Trichomalopsis sarcophagae TaxID=543379 RepID=A0A232EV54_9HYME|nr:hypothetical protein TSAR_002520 [Trichomalopsis sarcophagae]